ncbi:glycosyltransferase family 4 protein [Candidatus Parcubacteria bacterium]|nr:MAG: glycosyltransferase family 4 protein [Candidatus Parcubacteria bacterium]
MKVAIVHYWLVGMRGGEKVIEQLCELFPQADIFTHVYDEGAVSETIRKHHVNTTFINRLPKAKSMYQSYLPLMPLALEQLDLRGYDLVISSESGPSKGVLTDPEAVHICYCHTPMRYIWDMYQDYYRNSGKLKRLVMPPLLHYLRMWDVSSSTRVDQFVANSNFIAKRIKKYYRRDADVIHPPVVTHEFDLSEKIEDYYLMVGQLVKYKRADLAVDAFNRNGKKLIIIGEGDEIHELKKRAKGNIMILGRKPFETIKKYYSECKALVFPGLEDFGIVPLEAMASGRPVIAYGRGGALDYVHNGKTGILFEDQTVDSLNGAIEKFESSGVEYSPSQIKEFAELFSASEFRRKFDAKVKSIVAKSE